MLNYYFYSMFLSTPLQLRILCQTFFSAFLLKRKSKFRPNADKISAIGHQVRWVELVKYFKSYPKTAKKTHCRKKNVSLPPKLERA